MTTGGTIGTARNYATRLTGHELLSLVQGADEVASVELDEADARPSPDITPADMWALAQRASRHLERADVDGIVITYGTDAMDEFIYLLYLCIPSQKPLIVTGAMMHSREPGADGPRNLYHAFVVAGRSEARGRGALLVMNGQIHSARDAVKVSSVNLAAFASPKFGPVGTIEGQQVFFRRAEPPRTLIAAPCVEPAVDLLAASVGMDGRLVDASVAAGARGLVVAAMGSGAVTRSMGDRLVALAKQGFPVVVATRCLLGSVLGREQGEPLILPAHDLPAHKARIQLMLALGATRGLAPREAREELRRCFGLD
jgi:L-asparaginase